MLLFQKVTTRVHKEAERLEERENAKRMRVEKMSVREEKMTE